MKEIIDGFNNRDVSLIIWVVIVLTWLLFVTSMHKSLFGMLKIFTFRNISTAFSSLCLYIFLLIFLLYKAGFWNLSMVKDIVYWFVGVIVLFVNASRINKDDLYFKKIFVDCLKWTALVQFIINLEVFNLITELILLPTLVVISIRFTTLDSPEYKQIDKYKYIRSILLFILSTIGWYILLFTLSKIIADLEKFVTLANLYSFLLPLILTFFLLPYLYLLGLYMLYENIFTRSNHWQGTNNELANYLKHRLLFSCHVNLQKLKAFSKEMNFMQMRTKEEILTEMQEFEAKWKNRKSFKFLEKIAVNN